MPKESVWRLRCWIGFRAAGMLVGTEGLAFAVCESAAGEE